MKQNSEVQKPEERLLKMSKEELLGRVMLLEKENINLKQGVEALSAEVKIKAMQMHEMEFTIMRFPIRYIYRFFRKFSFYRLKNTD